MNQDVTRSALIEGGVVYDVKGFLNKDQVDGQTYKKQYDIIRVGSFPTMEQHGRGRHNLELSRVYTPNTLFITWKTPEALVTEAPDLDIKKLKFYDKSVRSGNIVIDRFNRIVRISHVN